MSGDTIVQTIDVVDGRLAYRRWDDATLATPGDDRAPALILLHGFTGSSASWTPIAAALAAHRTVYAFDLPGHGLTELGSTKRPCDMEAFSDALDQAIEALELAAFDLLGYSLGGRSALHFAIRGHRRPRRLVLESASAGISDEGLRRQRIADDESLAVFIETRGLEAFVERWEQTPVLASQRRLPEEETRRLRQGRLGCAPEGLAMSLRGMGTGSQLCLDEALDALEPPLLCISGEEDEKFCSLARDIVSRVPAAQHVVLREAGHSAHLDQPRLYIEVVNEFLGAVAAAQSTSAAT